MVNDLISQDIKTSDWFIANLGMVKGVIRQVILKPEDENAVRLI